ncbi:hypothetical protein V6N13_005961 [Hibiscus sabdariffa]
MSIQNRGARCQGPRVPVRFRSKRGTAWDQGVSAGSRSFQHGPGATGTREGFPDRPRVRQKDPGGSRRFQARPAPGRGFQTDPGCARRTLGVPEEAESLVDYSNHKESTSKPKDQKEGQGKVWRDRSPRKETHRDNTPLRHQESSSWKGKAKDAQGLRKPSSSKCFICDGDHWARQCPQRQALSSLLARYQEENDVDGCQEGAHIGSLQLLNGIQSTPKIETKGLLFVDVAINGKATRAMVDTGIEFLDQVKAIPMPFVNAISITKGNQACVVPMIRGTKQESKVLSALQLEEEDTNRDSLETSMLPFPTCYKGKSRAQHRGAKRRRHQTDKMQRPPKFKEGSTHRGRKSKIRRSISTIPRRPRDEGIAGLGGGGCHDPPSCPRLNQVRDDREGTMSIQNRGARCQGPRVPVRFRSKRGTAWDQGVPAGSRSFQHGPGATGTREGFPDRPRVRQKDPGGSRRFQARPAPGRGFQTDPGCARRTLGVPEGSRRDRHPGGASGRPGVRQKDPGGSRSKGKRKPLDFAILRVLRLGLSCAILRVLRLGLGFAILKSSDEVQQGHDDMFEMLDGIQKSTFVETNTERSSMNTETTESEGEVEKFRKLLNDAQRELYPGCKYSKLSFLMKSGSMSNEGAIHASLSDEEDDHDYYDDDTITNYFDYGVGGCEL